MFREALINRPYRIDGLRSVDDDPVLHAIAFSLEYDTFAALPLYLYYDALTIVSSRDLDNVSSLGHIGGFLNCLERSLRRRAITGGSHRSIDIYGLRRSDGREE